MKNLNWRVALCAFVFCGCENIVIPLDLESDSATLDVDEAVLRAEADLCADEMSENCMVLKALDAHDGTSETPPKLPDEIPTILEIDMDNDPATPAESKDIKQWLDDSGVMSAIRTRKAIGADLTNKIQANKDSIQDVTFDTVTFNWQENSLSFETMDLDFFVGMGIEADEDGKYDADALITDGLVTKVGTIRAQAAGDTGESEVEFTEEGKALLNDAIKSLQFVVAVSIPEDAEIDLDPDGDDLLVKPAGLATVSLKTRLNFTVATQAPGGSSGGADDTAANDSAEESETSEEEAGE